MPRKALPRKQAKVDSMQCSMCQHVQGLTLMCVPNSDSASSKWFDTETTCHIQAFSTWHWNRMSCIEALLIEPAFFLPSAFRYKKPGFLPRTPLPQPNEPHNFLCEMAPYMEICYAYGRGQPCRERQPLWSSHDGLNLTCLDQWHRVRSHGKSSSQSWRKRIVTQQSEFSL